jgi:hypothetical protein
MLKAEEFPAGVTDLDTTLTNMYTDDFSHFYWGRFTNLFEVGLEIFFLFYKIRN